MYVDIIDKVTKCHFLWNGDQCKVLLKKQWRAKNQSSRELWTAELSRVPFWDKTMPTTHEEGKKKALDY